MSKGPSGPLVIGSEVVVVEIVVRSISMHLSIFGQPLSDGQLVVCIQTLAQIVEQFDHGPGLVQDAQAGLALVQQAAQRVSDREAKAEREIRLEAAKTVPERANGRGPTQTYRNNPKALYARFGASMDLSRADYMIGVDMARKGFTPDQIGQASPELPTRKAGHEADYVARVMQHPEAVRQAREAQPNIKRERNRGLSLG